MNQKVTLDGKGVVTLNDNNYVAQGGEGVIYRKGDIIVKIYSDVSKMHDMRDKVKRLSQLKHRCIVSPDGIALNSKSEPIGFYMPFVDGEPLSLLFTNDFRQRAGISDGDSSIFTEMMRDVFQFAHANGAILVDPNELNWLALLKGPEPRVIDVDSWVIDGKIPGTVAKMPSIRDWHGKGVSEDSDWFAFAIVTFQIYCGIHPFKGGLDGYKPSELERRMKDNASVFTKGVRLNHAVRDFSCIPGKLLEWYRNVFSSSARSVPPSPFDKTAATPPAIAVDRVVVTATGKLKHEKIFEKVGECVTRVFPCGVVQTVDHRLYDLSSGLLIAKTKSGNCELIRVENGWLISEGVEGFSYISFTEYTSVAITLSGRKVVTSNNRMFLVTERGLTELSFRFMTRPILTAGNTWGALVNSTKWFNGVGIQDALGAMFLILPIGASSCVQARVRELDGLTPITATSGHRFVSVIALDKSGTYQKLEFYFDIEHVDYKVWQGVSAGPELNLVMLPKGVGATIIDDGELTIFVPSNGQVKKIQDSKIRTDMMLSRWDNTVTYIQNGSVWKVSVT